MTKKISLLFPSILLAACTASTGAEPITNFDECVAAGNPVMESYPEQCRTEDGTVFVNQKQALHLSVSNLEPGDTVTENIVVEGTAPGSWYFEASFPVELQDSDGNVLAQVPAQALGDWMTIGLVPFRVEFSVDFNGAESGTLILRKDNPSGLPEHDDEVEIPLLFRSAE